MTVAVRSRPLAILTSIGFLVVGYVTWAVTGPLIATHMEQGGGIVVALWAGSAILAVLACRLADPRTAPDEATTAARNIASWIIPAVVGPLALYPLALTRGPAATAFLAVLWPLSALPLGLTLSALRRRHRTGVAGASVAAAALAASVGVLPVVVGHVPIGQPEVQFLAVCAVVGLPAMILLATPRMGVMRGNSAVSSTQVTEQATFAVAGLAPALGASVFILPWATGIVALGVAMGVVALAGRLAVRPLAWVAARADAQRDLAVAVSEAERRRLAADLHDGPLQDVLLLARRLDLAGDPEGATLARGIGEDLRELSGDLRLPMLDDLGVGAALDWLAGRIHRMTGVDVRVEYATDGRVPPDVELAAFRIAQEAITNAVRHGQPPVVVRCRTSAERLSLSIEDAGGGLSHTARPEASGPARFGILNMQQRAEQVGARLEFRQPRSGGTQVALEWRVAGAGA